MTQTSKASRKANSRRGKLKRNETNSRKKKKIKKAKKSGKKPSLFSNVNPENPIILDFLPSSDGSKNKSKKRNKSARTTAPKETQKSKRAKRKKKKSSKIKSVLGKRKQPKERLSESKDTRSGTSSLKQVKIQTLFKTQNMFHNIDFSTAPPEMVFAKLVLFQKNYKSNSEKDRRVILEDLLKELDPGITRMTQHLQQSLRPQVSPICRARFAKVFRNCLFLRSMRPFSKRSLWSEVYQPTAYGHLFSNNQMLQIEEHLHAFFYHNAPNASDSLVAQSQTKRVSRPNPFFESLQKNSKSGLRFLSQRSQVPWADSDHLVRQNLLLLLGPRSSGKFTSLKVFARKCNYELEVIDFALQNKVLSIKRKYLHAVGTTDVKVNLLDQFRKQKSEASRKVRESSSHSLDKFFKKTPRPEPRRSDDSQLQKLLKKHTKRKIFVCKNLDFLFDFNYRENKRRFRKNFGEFLMFLRRSKYPFVFTSCDEQKCFRVFGRSLDSIKVVQISPPLAEEVVQFLFIIVFIERMFGRFLCQPTPRPLTSFFELDSSGQPRLLDPGLDFTRHVPHVARISQFVRGSRADLSWVLEKAFLFRKSFFDDHVSQFQATQLEVNRRKALLSNVAATFPHKHAILKKSWLEESLDKLLAHKAVSEPGRARALRDKLYRPLASKKRKSKKKKPRNPRAKLTALRFLNPCLPFLKRRKTDSSEWLNLFRNSLNLQVLADNAAVNLGRHASPMEHLRRHAQPDLGPVSEPCLEFGDLWVSKKLSEHSVQKVKGYYCNFEQDHSEIEKCESQIRTYNGMFQRQAPLAFIHNSQLRFSAPEIDFFKQVSIVPG